MSSARGPVQAEFYIFRHGETDWNAAGRMQGTSAEAPGLNAAGRRQAEAMAVILASEWARRGVVAADFDAFSSPLPRACETLRRMAPALAIDVWTTVPELAERSYGLHEGMTRLDVKTAFPDEHRARRADRWTYRPPGGESLAACEIRVRLWLRSLSRPAIICTHAGILRAVRRILEGLTCGEAAVLPVPHGRVFHWDGARLGELCGRQRAL